MAPKVVYGGPYLAESEAITAESLKENPNYDALVADWETISTGAEEYIQKITEGFEAPVGVFITNVVEEEKDEVEIPAVVPFIASDEDAGSSEPVPVETEPETVSEEEQANFDKELGL